ncbi:MAG: hypothetical protein K8W52_35470, partial [Deltaproteobacteria bacterium]|nr:hypothetical protein [Deltaproteobacteria bacterium]
MRATVALALALALAAPAVARADKSARVPGTNLSVRVAGSSLEVKQQRTVAPIPVLQPWPDLFMDVTVEAKGDAITISIDGNCSGEHTIKTTEAALRARLANVTALGLHRGKQWDAAAAGFAKALALDPTLVPAAL